MITAFIEASAAVPYSDQATTLLDLMMKGGVIMIPIVLLSIVTFYIFIERMAYIRRTTAIEKGLIPSVTGDIKSGNSNNAILRA